MSPGSSSVSVLGMSAVFPALHALWFGLCGHLLLLLPACTRPGPLVWSLPAGLTAVGLPLLGGVVPQQVSGEAVGGLSVLARLQRALPPGSRRELGFAVSCVVLRCCLWLLQSGHLRGHWLVRTAVVVRCCLKSVAPSTAQV